MSDRTLPFKESYKLLLSWHTGYGIADITNLED
jgi:hypothetical protein